MMTMDKDTLLVQMAEVKAEIQSFQLSSKIKDDGAESELISACLTPSFPHLLINITILKPSVKEVLGVIWPQALCLRRGQT